MKRLIALLVFLTATVAFAAKGPTAESPVKVRNQDAKGVPTFVTGELGQLAKGSPDKTAKEFLKSQKSLLSMTGTEDFDVASMTTDSLGDTHVKFQQKIRGLRVVGGEYVVHSDRGGKIKAMNGRFAPDADLPRAPMVNSWTALERAAAQASIKMPKWLDNPELVYLIDEKSNVFLAWYARAEYKDAEGRQIDRVYADALTGHLVQQDGTIHHARNRATYTANNGFTLPGTLVLTETTGSTSDVTLQKAHDYAGVTYDYYWNIHGRDSYNNAGAQMKSSVHYGSNYNNAGWTGTQMVYGDGDGSTFGPFSRSLDVVAHELTHAVTQYSANLVYQNESGALNEASSDILGVSAEAWSYGSVSSLTWKLGEDCYTPGTAGDALRYMNDPALTGSDKDYYPERYTGTADHGGVHSNSGIGNLAYYLMVMGGTHPRGKTSIVVPAQNATPMTSITMAAKIWYRALTVYMTSSTTFAQARTATAQAATDLYGTASADAVHKAWDAVGVPGTPGGGGGTTTLTNGVAQTGLSASTGTWKHFKIVVPAGQSKLEIVQSGGTGDADMYVKRGAQPTLTVYDYRPYLNGNNETVTVNNPVAGDWFISIYAYATYSGASLKATYTAPPACTMYTGSLAGTGSVAYAPASTGYVSSVSGTHTGQLTGTGTDFDLYLQKLSGSTWSNVASGTGATATENVTYSGTSGTYRWRIYAYSGGGTYSLCTTKP